MVLEKKERRIIIGIGLLVGVTMSSLLVRHAINVKDQQAIKKPGSYHSLVSAINHTPFPSPPDPLTNAIPNGIVVYYEANCTSQVESMTNQVHSWVIETTGFFRSERLFILVEQPISGKEKTKYFRASELYLKIKDGFSEYDLEQTLEQDQFRVIGQNQATKEYIVQLRNISPSELSESRRFLKSLPLVKQVRLSPWSPRNKN